MPDTATALLIEVQADGLARERVLSAQVNEPLLVPETSSPTWNPVTFGPTEQAIISEINIAIAAQPGNRCQFQAHPRLTEPGARKPHPTW
jgi:hypothetical protein